MSEEHQGSFETEFYPRETEMVSINLPKDVLESLKKVAASRDMSYQALLKFYIGQGLRLDVARLLGQNPVTTDDVEDASVNHDHHIYGQDGEYGHSI